MNYFFLKRREGWGAAVANGEFEKVKKKVGFVIDAKRSCFDKRLLLRKFLVVRDTCEQGADPVVCEFQIPPED